MNLPGVITQTISRHSLLVQKASPELLLAAGIVGVVGSTVLACRATLKLEALLDETQQNLEVARTIEHPKYSESDRASDIRLIYTKTTVGIIKLYTPAVAVGVLSVSALIASNRILNNRNIALAAAYSALDRGFREYRARVVEKYGDDQDREFRYGAQRVQIEDPVTGKKKTVTRALDEAGYSIYAKFFDEGSPNWNRDPEINFIFLQASQNMWNDKLRARGHVFLNEVYEHIGIPHTKEGAVVGWVWGDDSEGDNYIDFGIFSDRERVREFVKGREASILLDFNVDGVIYDLLSK